MFHRHRPGSAPTHAHHPTRGARAVEYALLLVAIILALAVSVRLLGA